MRIGIVVALTRDGVIGKNNQLPWRLPQDLKRFREITIGHPVIMGRKTFESIGRPLPGRLNVVISRNSNLSLPPGVALCSSYDEAIATAKQIDSEKIFVIGGGEIFKEALSPKAKSPVDDLYLTWIDTPFEGDAKFPLDLLEGFEVVETQSFREPFAHSFVNYRR